MFEPTNALTLQLLEWISNGPRTYAEALDAWRTSCPRLSIWEDACIAGLIDCEPEARSFGQSQGTGAAGTTIAAGSPAGTGA